MIQRFSILGISAILALSATTVLAQTDASDTPCSSLVGMERTKCLVKERQETLKKMGRPTERRFEPPDNRIFPIESSRSSVSSEQSSVDPGTGCARLYGVARGQCLVQKRRNEMNKPTRLPAAFVPARTRPQNCARYGLGTERQRCLGGEKMGGNSSSSSSSS